MNKLSSLFMDRRCSRSVPLLNLSITHMITPYRTTIASWWHHYCALRNTDVVLRNLQPYSTGSRAAHTDKVQALLLLETARKRSERLGK